jgi:Flp pilus assembly protein CpaB
LKRSNRLVLLIGIFLALVAFVLIVLMLGNGGGTGGDGLRSQAPTTAPVVVAARNIDLGAKIQASDVTTKDIAVADKPSNAYGDTALVIGQVARTSVTAGQLITTTVLSDSGAITDLEVPAGFVALSVRVDQTTGVGTLIKAGDFVDIVTGFTTPDNVKVVVPNASPTADNPVAYQLYPADQYNETTVKVLSQGLQVLGTLLPPPPTNGEAQPSASPSAGTTTLNGQEQLVIIAVPTQDAEVIKFAQMEGDISLVLRSSEDCTTKPADGITYCPTVATTGITLRRLVDDRGVLPPTVVQVLQPTPLPGSVPARSPRP